MTLSAAKCLPRSCVLNWLTVKSALEKHLSQELDVAEMQRYFEASCFKRGSSKFVDQHFICTAQKVKKF